LSVLRVFLVCAAGVWLARRGVMTAEFRRTLSRVILLLLLPCFLVSKLSASVNVADLLRWSILPLAALVYIALGMLIGCLVMLVCRPPAELRRVVAAATAFGNSGYIPLPLVMAIAATATLFQDDPTAADRGVAYVSVYLIGMSPCLWGIAYPYLSDKPLGRLRPGQILSPPVCSVLCGITFGVVGPLRRTFVNPEAPLRALMDACELVGMAAIPCGLLILGANLADPEAKADGLPAKTILAVGFARLVLLPAVGCTLTLWLRRVGAIPQDPMFALVLMLEAAVPPATNLIVMCQVHNRGEAAMSKLLVWCYILAVPSLTAFGALFLWLIGNS